MAVQGHPAGDQPAEEVAVEGLQPFLHDTCTTLYAPSLVLSRPDGDIATGADGFFHGDRRALSALSVRVEGVPVAPIARTLRAADETAFRAVLRGVGEHTADPAVTLHRVRRVEPGALREELSISNAGLGHVRLTLVVRAATDLARMVDVKSGRSLPALTPQADADGLTWTDGGLTVALRSAPGTPAAEVRTAGSHAELRHHIELPPGETWQTTVECTVQDREPDQFPAVHRDAVPWQPVTLRSADRSLDHLVARSVGDLERLLLSDPQAPEDVFLAAGSPWFLTLFGRDSLWAARMLLPLGTELAAGTLRTLARRQGAAVDPRSEEQPGKILHEVRREELNLDERTSLPPVYYGTVDATPLWITLLRDAWRWGLDPEQVRELLPHAEAALEWLATYGDADGDGLLEYIDTTGRGLANQGWKDSGDSIRWRDGRLAEAPIALCEVQAYGYEAALAGAELLRAFGRPGADRWEEWADRLRRRFRESFWVEDETGRYPAVALDAKKQPVDSVTSGFGHLLGTGLLDQEESALLAARIAGPELDSGFGLRTLSTDSTGFNPLGYHIGSIWPHDTAIAVHGLVRAGFPQEAAALAEGLIAASEAFEGRLPELFAGHGSAIDPAPAPYPAACRPQAWSAASAVVLLQAALGLDADVPGGTLSLSPAAHSLRPLRLDGLRIAGHPLSVALDADGRARVTTSAPVRVVGADTGVDPEADSGNPA
ncbi:amylo-alpha-1,6-glucosidase [Peterkaempfera bronchialis]|uniref:Amylo-alpha-1,6-glucosidase n=1 Tax=Peterkaempfera bronchialis TaxID=2126346 RepID=A0A345T549_9ACTN|nr:glycogen debranching N-terminal domain-containing protein [Peterkaempfera bronchialis]AXI81104.1 amylo-alpha-1,6-glucosidase [Peterkaempfera bronchialis]